MNIREATSEDISVLAKQHIMMFEDIWEHKRLKLEPEKTNAIEKEYIKKLEAELPNGTCKAWVIEDNGKIVSGGAITFISLVPNPYDLSSKVAFMHSMYTDKSFRNRKCAQKIIEKIIDCCRSQGVKRIILNASDAGKPVYEKTGFHYTPESMRLIIE